MTSIGHGEVGRDDGRKPSEGHQAWKPGQTSPAERHCIFIDVNSMLSSYEWSLWCQACGGAVRDVRITCWVLHVQAILTLGRGAEATRCHKDKNRDDRGGKRFCAACYGRVCPPLQRLLCGAEDGLETMTWPFTWLCCPHLLRGRSTGKLLNSPESSLRRVGWRQGGAHNWGRAVMRKLQGRGS